MGLLDETVTLRASGVSTIWCLALSTSGLQGKRSPLCKYVVDFWSVNIYKFKKARTVLASRRVPCMMYCNS